VILTYLVTTVFLYQENRLEDGIVTDRNTFV